jgi:hypothetical protein
MNIPKDWIARKAKEEIETGSDCTAGDPNFLLKCDDCGGPLGADFKAQVGGNEDGSTTVHVRRCKKCDEALGKP